MMKNKKETPPPPKNDLSLVGEDEKVVELFLVLVPEFKVNVEIVEYCILIQHISLVHRRS